MSVRKGGARIRIIAESSPFSTVGRFEVLACTWLINDDGAQVFQSIGNWKAIADQELRALLKSDKVDTVMFDNVAPRARHPVWSSSAAKFITVIWLSGAKDHGPPDGFRSYCWIDMTPKRHGCSQMACSETYSRGRPWGCGRHPAS